jgi:hypothetical protein
MRYSAALDQSQKPKVGEGSRVANFLAFLKMGWGWHWVPIVYNTCTETAICSSIRARPRTRRAQRCCSPTSVRSTARSAASCRTSSIISAASNCSTADCSSPTGPAAKTNSPAHSGTPRVNALTAKSSKSRTPPTTHPQRNPRFPTSSRGESRPALKRCSWPRGQSSARTLSPGPRLPGPQGSPRKWRGRPNRRGESPSTCPRTVSYTHLTLPTID